MPTQARVVWDESFTRYNFGPTHPMAPIRLDLTARLCQALGVFDLEGVQLATAEPASEELLMALHDPAYVRAVMAASKDPAHADQAYGLGTDDDPAFEGMHEASARIVTGTLEACQAVWRGEAEHAVNFTGGMHHSMPDKASGFCIYNDAAAGIRWLLENGAERVAYVDIDVHHGDGVEKFFWDDDRVLTISVHESGRMLFPGTGWPTDIGGPSAQGSAVNVALAPGTDDAGWLRAVHSMVLPLVTAFRPDVLVSQHGCDTHVHDPLAHLSVTVDAQRAAAQSMHRLAHEVCDGRWVALGGGGYEVVDVVPRSWTHLTAIAAHAPILTRTPVPTEWLEHVEQVCGRRPPEVMGDLSAEDGPVWWRSWDMGYDPGSDVDRAIMATRNAVFPLHGLDVYFD